MKEEDIYRDLCLVTNDYFAAKIACTDVFGTDIYLYVVIYRKDTWESYKSFNIQSIFSDLGQKQWFETAEKFITQLEKPEDWKKTHRFCLARYARQVLADSIFHNNLAFLKRSTM